MKNKDGQLGQLLLASYKYHSILAYICIMRRTTWTTRTSSNQSSYQII